MTVTELCQLTLIKALGQELKRACLHGSNQWCITDLWTSFKYFLIWHSAVPYCDINLGPRSSSDCLLTWLQHAIVTAMYTLLCIYGVKEISVSCRVAWYCAQSNTDLPGWQKYWEFICHQSSMIFFFFSFFLFSYAWIKKSEPCFWKENSFATLLWSCSWWEMHSTAFVFITLPVSSPWLLEMLEGLKSFSASPVTKIYHLLTWNDSGPSLVDGWIRWTCTVLLLMAAERPQMEQAGHWHPTPSSCTAKPAVANARPLWGKLRYKHLISSSCKFPWFSEWLPSQVTWDKGWLSPCTYYTDVQRVYINQCWRKAFFKVFLLVPWERAIQWAYLFYHAHCCLKEDKMWQAAH